MLTANKERFKLMFENLITYHPEITVVIDKKRDTRKLMVGEKAIAITSDEINKTGRSSKMNPFGLGLIHVVKRSFKNYLQKHLDDLILMSDGMYDLPRVPYLNGPIYNNKELYSNIPVGTDFYMIDLKHAYWRIAYNKGYISEELYYSHITKAESKLYRNMALACMVAHNTRSYYKNGELILEVSEVCTPFETMYANIRHTCYNAVGDCVRYLPFDVFATRTDSVYVTMDKVDKARRILYNRGFLLRTEILTKVDDIHYSNSDGEVKKI